MEELGALAGAIPVAAVVSYVVAGRQIKAQSRAWQRTELRALVADFWGACDRLFRVHRAQAFLISEIQIGRIGRDPEESERLESERQRSFTMRHEAEEQASQSLALIRILFPNLADVAQELFDTSANSWNGRIDVAKERTGARASARGAFEDATRKAFKI